MWHPVFKGIMWSSISRNGLDNFFLETLPTHLYFGVSPLFPTQTDWPQGHWESLGLWNAPASYFHMPGHTWDLLERKGGSHDSEKKLNIGFGSTEGKCRHHYHHHHHHCLLSQGGGGLRELPGIISWQTVSNSLAGGDRWSQNSSWAAGPESSPSILGQQSGSSGEAGLSLWESRRLRDVFQPTKKSFPFWHKVFRWISNYWKTKQGDKMTDSKKTEHFMRKDI